MDFKDHGLQRQGMASSSIEVIARTERRLPPKALLPGAQLNLDIAISARASEFQIGLLRTIVNQLEAQAKLDESSK